MLATAVAEVTSDASYRRGKGHQESTSLWCEGSIGENRTKNRFLIAVPFLAEGGHVAETSKGDDSPYYGCKKIGESVRRSPL